VARPGDLTPSLRERRWGLGDAAAGMVVGLVVANLLAGIVAGASGEETFATVVAGLVGLWVGLLGAPVWASRRKGTGSLAEDFGLRTRWTDAVAGLPLGLACQLLLVPLYLPLQRFIDEDEIGRPAEELADKAQGPAYVLLAVLLIVGAPFVEELFFRGLLLRALSRRFGDGWAVGGSAVAFGLAHFQVVQFPALVFLGAVLGFVAVRTGRLGPGIWAHAGFNAIVVAALA